VNQVAEPQGVTPQDSFARRLPHVSPQRLQRLRQLFAAVQTLSPALAARLALNLFQRPFRRHLDAVDKAWLAEGHISRIRLDQQWLQIYQWGSGQKTVVLAHGWGSHAPRFAPLAQALVNEGWRVVSFDAPAHGMSTGSKSNLFAFKLALRAVLEQFGPAQALVGHSFGALAILLSLNTEPDHPCQTAQKVVLISMPSGVPFLVAGYVTMLGLNDRALAAMKRLFHQQFGCQPEDLLAANNAAQSRHPFLLIHDQDDDVVPLAHSIELQRLLPTARLHTTAGLGHSGLLRDTATITAICAELRTL
jgi:pimeloyl-ACP methyl ester carboxylesterase